MVLNDRNKLHGTVEVNEVVIGRRTSEKGGREVEGKRLMSVAVEVKGRNTGRVRLENMQDATAKAYQNLLKRSEPKPTVITDG